MTSAKRKNQDNIGCSVAIVLVLVAIAAGLMYGGKAIITSDSAAQCGSGELEEGQTCKDVDTGHEFGAEEARGRQDTAKDIFGWIFVGVGGLVGVLAIAAAGAAVHYRLHPEKEPEST